MHKLFGKILTLFAAALAVAGLQAQERKLTIEDCFNTSFQPQQLSQLSWLPKTSKFAYVAKVPYSSKNDPKVTQEEALIVGDAFSNARDTAVRLSQLNKWLSPTGSELKRFPRITWKDEYRFWFASAGKIFQINRMGGEVVERRQFNTAFEAIEISEVNHHIATVEQGNIFAYVGSSKIAVTRDGGNGLVYGQAAHRNEFGISKGLFWSPDGKKLAFYKQDESRVTEYPILNNTTRPTSSATIRYPMAGDSSHTVSIGVYNTETGETIYLETKGPYDQYLTNITWSTESDRIYLAWVNRDQNHMQLRWYHAGSGELGAVLYEEKHPKYVEPEHGFYFVPGSNTDFLWISEKSGFNHVYFFVERTKKMQQITEGNWEVTKIIGFDKTGEQLFFEGTRESPLERHVYTLKYREKDPKIKRITSGNGMHQLIPQLDMGLAIDVFTNRKEPRRISVLKTDGSAVNEIFKSFNPLEGYAIGQVKIDPILVNNQALYSRMVLPYDFDPTKKYPVVVYVYGGPHAQMITESWQGGAPLWMHYLAQNGYIVFTVDNRGSEHRGFEFESATFRRLGTVEMEDQLAALRYIKKFPYIDSTRLGVHGWSFGGFMTTSLMTRTPGQFKVGVAGGPVIDWRYYEIMYTERYMDKPDNNPMGYDSANLLKYAGNLEGRLLMIHGTSDDVVLWQHSLMYLEANVKAKNANLDYFVYPGHLHNVLGEDRKHLYKKVCQYFFDYL